MRGNSPNMKRYLFRRSLRLTKVKSWIEPCLACVLAHTVVFSLRQISIGTVFSSRNQTGCGFGRTPEHGCDIATHATREAKPPETARATDP